MWSFILWCVYTHNHIVEVIDLLKKLYNVLPTLIRGVRSGSGRRAVKSKNIGVELFESCF